MAEYSTVSVGLRIFVLVLLVIVLLLGGIIWFDYLGLIDAKTKIAPIFGLFGIKRARVENVDDPLLLDKERLKMQIEALALRTEELAVREEKIIVQEQELAQIQEQLEEKEGALEDREKMFNERTRAFENRRVNLEQNSAYLVGMPPDNAVKILIEMDDQDIIDVFRMTEELAKKAGEASLVSYWLSLMPAERAAVLQRKMAGQTGG